VSTTDRRPVIDPESALGFLAQASGVLAGSLDYERTLTEVARLAVPDLADWCAVDLAEPDGTLRQITSVHPDPEQQALLMELRRRYREEKGNSAGASFAIAAGEPLLATDVTSEVEIELRDEERDLYARLGPKSYMIVPLFARGRIIGALTLLSTREGRHYGEHDLEFAQHLARRFALAIDNARLYDEAEKSRAMLDTLFRSVPVGLGFLDLDLRCVRANDALAGLAGDAPETCSGRALAELVDERLEPPARRVLETGQPLLDHELERAGRHLLISVSPVRAHDDQVVGLGLVTMDVTESRELLHRTRFLAEVGTTLELSLDLPTTVANVARLAVPQLADWCVVHVIGESGAIEMVAAGHSDPVKQKLAWELAERFPLTGTEPHGAAAVIRSGETEWTPEVTDEMLRTAASDPQQLEALRGLGLRSSITVPLRARGRTLGAITLVLAESQRAFGGEHVLLAEELAHRAGLAIDNARLYTERSRIAHTLQSELLPSRLPDVPGATVAVRYRAAGELNEVGGDFYDVFERRDGSFALVIGDVSGKGAEAAAVTALARHTVRTAALQPAGPSDLLMTLNGALRSQRQGSEFCTVCVAGLEIDGAAATLRLALGGHPPALVLRAGGEVQAHGEPGTLIGVFPDPVLSDTEIALGPGDVLLLYTDGVIEAGESRRAIGEAGLAGILGGLAGCGADAIVDAVEREAVSAQEGQPRDDIALVAVRIDG
jgi:serine phosphatase RsbU (regulator of sigma subunit)/PAS domain-containing protein